MSLLNLPNVEVRHLSGRNARNTAFKIEIDPDCRYPLAVLAQELYESNRKRANLISLVGIPRILFSKSFKRDLELHGHAVEIAAAWFYYKAQPSVYRAKEASAMRAGYDGLFEDMTQAEIAHALEGLHKWATLWVNGNDALIREKGKAFRT